MCIIKRDSLLGAHAVVTTFSSFTSSTGHNVSKLQSDLRCQGTVGVGRYVTGIVAVFVSPRMGGRATNVCSTIQSRKSAITFGGLWAGSLADVRLCRHSGQVSRGQRGEALD